MNETRSTIAAIATPPGGGARAVIRVSGSDARRIAELVVRVDDSRLELRERGVFRGRFDDGRGEQPVIVLWMPGPRSFTREDVVEFHLPGAAPLAGRALSRLVELGVEPARPGEFTRRAFENGRIDLSRAEGVLAMVSAQNDEELRAARALLFGGLDARVVALRDELADLRALCVASLDFNEGDTGDVATGELLARARAARARVAEASEWESRREAGSGLPRVVLVGAPNAGKSSLFNRLAGARALVSDTPGTTRDPLSAAVSFGGRECRLIDTAGIAAGSTEVELAAQALGRGARDAADLIVWVVDSTLGASAVPRVEPEEASRSILAWNKTDLAGAAALSTCFGGAARIAVSARDGRGIEELGQAIERLLAERASSGLSRELARRHAAALERCREELDGALELLGSKAPLDLAAEALREATDALDDLSGRTAPEDLLDRIFARFCIGK